MARPRNIHFFEDIHPAGPGWLETYHENSRILVEYLKDHGAKRYATDSAIKCLPGLREYLIDTNITYSPEIAKEWLYMPVAQSRVHGILEQARRSFRAPLPES